MSVVDRCERASVNRAGDFRERSFLREVVGGEGGGFLTGVRRRRPDPEAAAQRLPNVSHGEWLGDSLAELQQPFTSRARAPSGRAWRMRRRRHTPALHHDITSPPEDRTPRPRATRPRSWGAAARGTGSIALQVKFGGPVRRATFSQTSDSDQQLTLRSRAGNA